MPLTVRNYVSEETGGLQKPGIYVSSKGTVVMVPEGSSDGKTQPALNLEVCMVLDVDTERTFLKYKRNLKGAYKYVCSWDMVEMHLGTDKYGASYVPGSDEGINEELQEASSEDGSYTNVATGEVYNSPEDEEEDDF